MNTTTITQRCFNTLKNHYHPAFTLVLLAILTLMPAQADANVKNYNLGTSANHMATTADENEQPFAPQLFVESNMMLGAEFEGTLYYSIDYVDESLQDVTNAVFSWDVGYKVLGPCTITAYSEVDGVRSKTTTGKYLGFAQDPLTVEYHGTSEDLVLPALVPAVAEGDGVTLVNPTVSNPASHNVLYIGQFGQPVVFAVGEATLTYELDVDYDEADRDYDVLNPYGVTLKVVVTESKYGLAVGCNNGESTRAYYVTDDNRLDVLGDNGQLETGNRVMFDGKNRLVLNNITNLSFIRVIEGSPLEDTGLEIYLQGENAHSGDVLVYYTAGQMTLPLTFTTDGANPGRLTSTLEINPQMTGASNTPFINVGDPAFLKGLTMQQTDNVVVIGTALEPIVNDAKGKTIDLTQDPTAGRSDNALDNDFIDGVHYALNDHGNPSDPDGFDPSKNMLCISTVLTNEQVNAVAEAVANGTLQPGSPEYASAENFQGGMTFLAPGGIGKIRANVVNAADRVFHIKIGTREAQPLYSELADADGWVDVPYVASEATYCYLYLAALANNAPQQGDSHRAGPKTSVSTGLKGLSVDVEPMPSPEPAAEYSALSSAPNVMGSGKMRYVVVDDPVTDVKEGIFASYQNDVLAYIDLSGTNVTGKSFDRMSEPFIGIPEETFIYVPAGNITEGKNIVAGSVCNNAELDGSSEEGFLVSKDFMAAKLTLKRTFSKADDDPTKATTIFLPFDIDKRSSAQYGQFYSFESYTDGQVNMKEEKEGLEANKPYMFRAATDGQLPSMFNIEVKANTGAVSNPGNANESEGLHGMYEYYKWNSTQNNAYCFSEGMPKTGNNGKLVKVSNGTTIHPFSAYLRISTTDTTTPESLTVNWEGSTGITQILNDDRNGENSDCYNLNGQRVAKPSKGLYIVNGRKVIVH